METVGILSLPTDVLLIISRYLSIDDLLSFSSSCHHLRAILNDNSVWRRFLQVYNDETLIGLQYEEMLNIKISQQTTLPPLCSNRLHLIRKMQILNNWTYGRCSSHVIQEEYGSLIEGNRRLISEMSMYSDSFVFLIAKFHKITAVELWSIKGNPVQLTNISYKFVNDLKVVGDYLLVFIACQICVHEICIKNKALPLKYVLTTSDRDLVMSSFPIECNRMHSEPQCISPWNHNVYKHILISSHNNKLFFWDIPKSLKHCSFDIPEVAYINTQVDVSYGNYVLLKTVKLDSKTSFKIVDIFKKQLLELKQLKGVPNHVVIQNSHIVTFSSSHSNKFERDLICSVYDIQTYKIHIEKKFSVINDWYLEKTIIIINGLFALPCKESMVEIVDASTLNIRHYIKCNHSLEFVVSYEFNILSTLFVAIADSSIFGIWNAERKRYLPRLPFLNNGDLRISFNKWCSKVVCYDLEMGTISVLNFI